MHATPFDPTGPLGRPSAGPSGGLPLPTPPSGHPRPGFSGRLAVSVINDRGRIAARAVTDHLGWQPGRPLHFALGRQGLVTISPDPTGTSRHTVSDRGHLRVPAAIRHATGITTGDALLLAALPERDLALLLPLRTQETLLHLALTLLQDPA